MSDQKQRSVDPAVLEMVEVAATRGLPTIWDRLDAQKAQCRFGREGLCCRMCFMGPCRVTEEGKGAQRGICGATAETIVARNLLRHVAGGAAAHSDHGREIVKTLFLAATGDSKAYHIRSPGRMRALAAEVGVALDGRADSDVAAELARLFLAEFSKQDGTLLNIQRAPEAQRANWLAAGVTPRGVDREIVTGLHMTTMGVDNDPEHLLLAAARVALADGWGGSMIATDLSDVLFGEPEPLRSAANLGVLKEDHVNILVHGHEPTLSDVIAAVSRDPQMVAEANAVGAKGINLAGICCTANEILMRHGIPIAGNFLQQELAVMTGAIDLLLVDVQCVFPALARLQECFHTKVVSTSPKAKFPGAEHIEFHEEHALDCARQIIRMAIDSFRRRDPAKVRIPKVHERLVAGFTTQVVFRVLGGRYRPSYRPLNDGIQAGRLRGVAGVVGCNNPKFTHDECHLAMVRELLRNDVLVV